MFARIITILFVAFLFLSVPAKGVGSIETRFHYRHVLSSREMPLYNRYPDSAVNQVFKDNILLTLFYMSGKVSNASQINWDEIRKPYHYELVLGPGEAFSFHEDVPEGLKKKVVATTHAHFNGYEGFLTDGWLYGDGVCHFASLLNWAARDAGLLVISPTNHNFANIPDVPMEYGTSIYFTPGQTAVNQAQNLYIENSKSKHVHISFDSEGDSVKVTVFQDI